MDILYPSGIISEEAFGTAIVTGPITVTGIVSGEGFGTAIITGPIIVPGIASAEAIGDGLVVHAFDVDKGQTVNFEFSLKAYILADILLKGSYTKDFPADIILAPHFGVKTLGADILLKGEFVKAFNADVLLRATKDKDFNADIILHSPYQPPEGLEGEQQKKSYIPFVEVEEIK